jgi:hypothetical protein
MKEYGAAAHKRFKIAIESFWKEAFELTEKLLLPTGPFYERPYSASRLFFLSVFSRHNLRFN